MKVSGLRMQICVKAWLAGRPESLITTPSETAVHWLGPKFDVGGQLFPRNLPGKVFVIAYGRA